VRALKRHVSIGVRFCLLFLPSAAIAGAWTLPEGSGLAIVTLSGSAANRSFGGAGAASTPRYGKLELQGLLEYGVTDRLTFILAPSLQYITIGAPVGAHRTGLGHTEIGGRYQVVRKDTWVLSAQATARIPGTRDPSNPAAIGYTDFESDLRLLFGRNFRFGALPAFIDLQLAQRLFEGGGPHEFRADFTFGVQPAARWMLLAQSFNVISEGAGRPQLPSYEQYKFQLSGVYAVTPRLAIQAGGFATYAGRNTLQENGGLVGLWYRF
jgi:hypothetical protein